MHLIYQQEIWVPTAEGWLVIIVCIATLMLFIRTHIYSFLALNRPIKADILVLEGWIQEDVMKEAIAEFERGGYQKLITVGPSLSEGNHVSKYKNFAERAAAGLISLGFDPDKLVAVPTPYVPTNRTYTCAVALRQWIGNSDLKVKSINLYTFDVHSRRNWLIFKKTFAPKIQVGVIAIEPFSYDSKKWWNSSTGVKSIVFETVAYMYVRFVNWRN